MLTEFKRNFWLDHLGENVQVTFVRFRYYIKVTCLWRFKIVAEFQFNELNGKFYRGEDAAIFVQDFKRRGLYTFVLDTTEKEFDCTVLPSFFLSRQGEIFWKKRKLKIHGKEKSKNAVSTNTETILSIAG